MGKWVRGNEKVARAWLGAYSEGQRYATENTMAWAKKYRNRITKNATDAQVKWFAEWMPKYGVIYKDAYIDQTFVDEETAFLKMALKAGFIKEGGLSPKMWKILKPLEVTRRP